MSRDRSDVDATPAKTERRETDGVAGAVASGGGGSAAMVQTERRLRAARVEGSRGVGTNADMASICF